MFISQLYDLPDEVLVNIISYLDARGMDDCSKVCKRFYRIMHSSVLLKYLRARSLAGFIDVSTHLGTSNPSPIIERYRRLRAHESNWRRLRWKKKSMLKLEASLGAYEMNGGVFGYSSRGNESIVFTVLSSVPEKRNLIQWHHTVNALDMMDFTFNCDLNLLCLIVRDYESHESPFAIHLRTMTSDSDHPEAEVPVLRCPYECRDYWPDSADLEGALIEFTVQVYYDRVACLYQLSSFGGRDMVVVWNWRTGEVVKIIHPPTSGRYTDMSFLSSFSLLICQIGGGASLNVVSWGLGLSGDKESTLLLRLPTLRNKYLYTKIQHHSNPSPSPSPPSPEEEIYSDNSSPPRKRRRMYPIPISRNFVASGEDRLLAFSTNIQKRTELDFTHTTGHYYLFFLSEKRLKAYLASLPHILTDPKEGIDEPPALDWSTWGPSQVRWIPTARTYGWAVCSRGMRFVCSPASDHGMGLNSQVMLLDFMVDELVPNEKEGVRDACEVEMGRTGLGGCENGWDSCCGGVCCLGEATGIGMKEAMGLGIHSLPMQVSRASSVATAGTTSSFASNSTATGSQFSFHSHSLSTSSASSSSSSSSASASSSSSTSASASSFTTIPTLHLSHLHPRFRSPTLHSPPSLPSNATLVTGRSVLPNYSPKIFNEEVESTLPYLQVISEEWLMDSVGFMMDEESIVSVKVSEHEISALEVMRFISSRGGGRV